MCQSGPVDDASGLGQAVQIMRRLRAPGGCPWDRQQTHASLAPYALEEAYEVVEAIQSGDANRLRDELGDLLLQVIFHALIAEETGAFDLEAIGATLAAKLIRRHPHVFGDGRAETPQQVEDTWASVKRAERTRQGLEEPESLLGQVPQGLPALLGARKLQSQAAKVGFDWKNAEGALAKLGEELAELAEARASGNAASVLDEYGDCLFVMANVGRLLGLEPEVALVQANAKFARRFRQMERLARQEGKSLAEFSAEQQELLWQEAKKVAAPGEPEGNGRAQANLPGGSTQSSLERRGSREQG